MPDLDAPSTPPAPSPDRASSTPHGDGGGLDDLYDIARLARRLDVEHATIRVWLSRKVPWLPPPDGRLNGGAVWRATTLEGVEERRFRRRPGRKPRFSAAPAAADVPRTGPMTGQIPVVEPAARTAAVAAVAAVTGQVPVVAPVAAVTGQIPVVAPVAAATGQIPVVPVASATGQVPVVRRGRHAAGPPTLTGQVPVVSPKATWPHPDAPPTP
ncbi:hypothetical protein [Cellulomonas telluris]|uniref:hypothetical protein n=1 Tax=Cellulomonas telluris TaxID=2306636 RepID=UPI0010A840BF|nr:hypothetical protein [Cellulomonas telluris]